MMPYIKLDDGYFRNPKIMQVGRDAKVLYIAGLCYAGSALTDGFIPLSAPRSLAVDAEIGSSIKAIKQLIETGLWIEVDGGYAIHDYLKYNSSSDHVHSKREAAKERMQRSRSQNVRANKSRSSREVREPETETETETECVSDDTHTNTSAIADTGSGVLEIRFERFWRSFPSKTGKGAARTAWRRLRPDDDRTAELIAAVERQKHSDRWQRGVIPNPATWLNQERWDDEPELIPAVTTSNSGSRPTVADRNEEAFRNVRKQFSEANGLSPGDDVIDVDSRLAG